MAMSKVSDPVMLLATLPLQVEPPPPEDPSRCRLLGPTALIVQAIMGIVVISSLIIKRQLESRKRPWRIWLWDVGKQLVGQAVIHALNLLISDQVASAVNNNPCSLYFLNVLIDTTIGVGIFYLALIGFTRLFISYQGPEGFSTGQYGHPPQPRYWWKQLMPYLLSIILMKLLVLLPLTLPVISTVLIRFGHALLDWLSPSIQVIFVMALFPLVMTVIQFCIVDQVIKGRRGEETDGYDEESGYARLPTADSEYRLTAGMRRGEQFKQDAGSQSPPNSDNPVCPSSPLLLSSRHGSPSLRPYGSLSRSPGPSSDGSTGLWKLTGAEDDAIHDGSSQIADDLQSTASLFDSREHRRSGAPSPDSMAYTKDTAGGSSSGTEQSLER